MFARLRSLGRLQGPAPPWRDGAKDDHTGRPGHHGQCADDCTVARLPPPRWANMHPRTFLPGPCL
ncbi:hypothetical protein GZL_06162 [Streptomyces sp. 769]|nr:hypothetical protein GZL_06162 [Streptomyces sp. 769]